MSQLECLNRFTDDCDDGHIGIPLICLRATSVLPQTWANFSSAIYIFLTLAEEYGIIVFPQHDYLHDARINAIEKENFKGCFFILQTDFEGTTVELAAG